MFSNQAVVDRMEALDVELIKVDFTDEDHRILVDLNRFDRFNIPVNIVVPADPNQPLIMLPEIVSPADALKALEMAAKGVEAAENKVAAR